MFHIELKCTFTGHSWNAWAFDLSNSSKFVALKSQKCVKISLQVKNSDFAYFFRFWPKCFMLNSNVHSRVPCGMLELVKFLIPQHLVHWNQKNVPKFIYMLKILISHNYSNFDPNISCWTQMYIIGSITEWLRLPGAHFVNTRCCANRGTPFC